MLEYVNLDAILGPIADGSPAGEYLRYAKVYDDIKEARREDEDITRRRSQRPRRTEPAGLRPSFSLELLVSSLWVRNNGYFKMVQVKSAYPSPPVFCDPMRSPFQVHFIIVPVCLPVPVTSFVPSSRRKSSPVLNWISILFEAFLPIRSSPRSP